MKTLKLKPLLLAILAVTVLSSCNDDDTVTLPLTEGMEITMRNSLQDPGEPELTYPSLFGLADDAWDESATLSNTSSEFPTALSQGTESGAPFEIGGLYDINLTETSIDFKVLPEASDPFWSGVFGLFPDGKYDRYYLTFSEPHNVSSFSSAETWVNIRIDSETVIVVELSEGYDLQPGVSFSITLQ